MMLEKNLAFFFFFFPGRRRRFFFSTVEKKTLVVTYLPTSPNLFPRRFSLSDSFLTAHARTPRSIAKLIEKTKTKKNQTRKKNKNKKTHTLSRPYAAGFTTDIESDTFAKGLDEDVVRAISAKKDEPEWLLDFRLRAFRKWLTMPEPDWSDNSYPQIDFQDYSYYSAPKEKPKKASLDEVDPDLLATLFLAALSSSVYKSLHLSLGVFFFRSHFNGMLLLGSIINKYANSRKIYDEIKSRYCS